MSADTTVKFEIGPIRNALTTESSKSFEIYAYDKEQRLVNFIKKDLYVTMQGGKSITNLKVNSASKVIGAITTHEFEFTTPVPIETSDAFVVTYPD